MPGETTAPDATLWVMPSFTIIFKSKVSANIRCPPAHVVRRVAPPPARCAVAIARDFLHNTIAAMEK